MGDLDGLPSRQAQNLHLKRAGAAAVSFLYSY